MSDKAGIAAIVCVERDFGIGKNGNLLVQIPDDMKRFAELTAGSVVIAGRKNHGFYTWWFAERADKSCNHQTIP